MGRNQYTTWIRPARAADADALRALTHTAYTKYIPLIGRKPLPMNTDFEQAVRDHIIDMMETDGVMIALIEMIIKPDHLWIENIAVHPDHQEKGLGQTCLAHAEITARENNRQTLKLCTNARFGHNVALYLKNGFTTDKTEPNPSGDVVYMHKSIRS